MFLHVIVNNFQPRLVAGWMEALFCGVSVALCWRVVVLSVICQSSRASRGSVCWCLSCVWSQSGNDHRSVLAARHGPLQRPVPTVHHRALCAMILVWWYCWYLSCIVFRAATRRRLSLLCARSRTWTSTTTIANCPSSTLEVSKSSSTSSSQKTQRAWYVTDWLLPLETWHW